MNSFFGIGILELFFILIIALLVLGPERLPGAIKEVAKYIRYFRNLSSELMAQFNEQFGDDLRELEDLHPQKLMNEFIGEEEKPKKSTKTAAKPKATSTAKSSATTKNSTSKTATTAKTSTATKGKADATSNSEKVAENGATDIKESATDKPIEGKKTVAKSDSATADVTTSEKDSSEESEPVAENRILPPPLDKKASGTPMGSIPEQYKRNNAPKETKVEDKKVENEVTDTPEVTAASVSTDSISANGASPTDEMNV